MRLMNHSEIVPAQAGIDGEPIGQTDRVLKVEPCVGLHGAAIGVADLLAARKEHGVREPSRQKVGEIVEHHYPPSAEIVERIDCGPAEFKSGLDVVLADHPGVVVKELP